MSKSDDLADGFDPDFIEAAYAVESAMVKHLVGLSEQDILTLTEYTSDLRGFAAEVVSEGFGRTVAEEDGDV